MIDKMLVRLDIPVFGECWVKYMPVEISLNPEQFQRLESICMNNRDRAIWDQIKEEMRDISSEIHVKTEVTRYFGHLDGRINARGDCRIKMWSDSGAALEVDNEIRFCDIYPYTFFTYQGVDYTKIDDRRALIESLMTDDYFGPSSGRLNVRVNHIEFNGDEVVQKFHSQSW